MPEDSTPKVHFVGPPESVPVYNCRAAVLRNASGQATARATELHDLTASGDSEREALQKLVAAFKRKIAEHVAAGEAIPWRLPADPLAPCEKEFFIAVHL